MTTQRTTKAEQRKRTHTREPWPEAARRTAVSAMITANPDHPMSIASVDAARAMLQATIGKGTLLDWLNKYGDEVRATLPQHTSAQEAILAGRDSTLRKMQTVVDKTLDRLVQDKVLDAMAGRDLAVVMGINRDHIRKDTGLPIEFEQLLRQLNADCLTLHYDPVEVLRTMVDKIHARVALPPPTDETDGRLLPPGE